MYITWLLKYFLSAELSIFILLLRYCAKTPRPIPCTCKPDSDHARAHWHTDGCHSWKHTIVYCIIELRGLAPAMKQRPQNAPVHILLSLQCTLSWNKLETYFIITAGFLITSHHTGGAVSPGWLSTVAETWINLCAVHFLDILCNVHTGPCGRCDWTARWRGRAISYTSCTVIGSGLIVGKCPYAGVSLVAQDAILEWQWKITERSRSCLSKGNNPHTRAVFRPKMSHRVSWLLLRATDPVYSAFDMTSRCSLCTVTRQLANG